MFFHGNSKFNDNPHSKIKPDKSQWEIQSENLPPQYFSLFAPEHHPKFIVHHSNFIIPNSNIPKS